MSRKENIGFSILLLAASGFGFYYSASRIEPTSLPIHHMLFPAVILGAITVLSLLRLILALHAPKKDGEQTFIALRIAPKSWITIVLIGLYVFTYKSLGFIITTFVYLSVQMLVLWPKDKKNYWLIGVISVICSFGLYFIFKNMLNVMLPSGLLYFL